MKAIFRAVGTAAVAAFFCVGCGGGGGKPSSLVGQWEYGSGAIRGKPESMELLKDGTGTVDKDAVSWKVENKRLVISSPSQELTCGYKVSGYELTIAYSDGDSAIFVRKEKLGEFKAKFEAENAKQIAALKNALEQLPKFTDDRDGKVYSKVKIGNQAWMAENLNYAAEGSKCYDNNDENCAKYGRLYNWSAAKQACPAGWRLPSDAEWTTLTEFVGGSSTAGTKLKSSAGWNNNGNGTNEFGFSALPCGMGNSYGSFDDVGNNSRWWSATEDEAGTAWGLYIYDGGENVNGGNYATSYLFSVRCMQDD